MHVFDIVVGAIVLVFVGIGIKRGFITEVFRLAAVLGGFIAASLFYKQAYAYLDFLSIPQAGKTAVAFILVYLGAALTVVAAGWVLKKLVHLSMLGWVDRLLGGLLGMAKVLLVVWIVLLTILLAPNSAIHKSMKQSITYAFFTMIPFRLSIPGLEGRFEGPEFDAKVPVEKLKEAKERLEGFREKVDSLKNKQDTIRKNLQEIKDAV